MRLRVHIRLWNLLFVLFAFGLAGDVVADDRSDVAKPASENDTQSEPKFPAEDLEFFEKKIRPLLQAHCVKCHGGETKLRGNFRLTSRNAILRGGDSGPAVSLDKPDEGVFLDAINYRGFEMPPAGKLPAEQIELLTRWVKMGLPWTPGTGDDGKPDAEHTKKKAPSLEEGQKHWAFQSLKRPTLPTTKDTRWIANPIDAFVLAKLEDAKLMPSAPADPVALVRRLYYDLTGLPPSPQDVDRFVQDHSPAAYERVVDSLLDSPHYGEKWGRHWLDLVHFAESNGYERDGGKPYAWRYRDYVIQSFNDDKPYDRFLLEQLAGDEIPNRTRESIIATGYFRLGIWDDEPADPQQARWDEIDDYVSTTSQVVLGITMNCCRCHDHKLDPLSQKDYYQLSSFFRDIRPYSNSRDVRSQFNLTDISPPEVRARYEQEQQVRNQQKSELTEQMTKLEDVAIAKMPAEERQAAATNDRPLVLKKRLKEFLSAEEWERYSELNRKLKQLEKSPDNEGDRELALSVNLCLAKPPETRVLIRGSAHAEGAKVEPTFPAVFASESPTIPVAADDALSSGRRTVLANWLTSRANPLTSRVFVNRLWQYHFGRGLVRSSSNFGMQGDAPTHPELLDWLAVELMDGGWKVKRIHKMILLSNSYRQSSVGNAAAFSVDPANHLLWRFEPRRLTAEEIRDSVLAVGGQLNLKMGGPSVYPPIPKEVLAGQSRPGDNCGKSPPEEANRRSVYIYVKRSLLVPVLSAHDVADTDSSCPIRYTTTVPTQALGMLNGEFANESARNFAERLMKEQPNTLRDQIRLGVRLTTGRTPSDSELDGDEAFVLGLRSQNKLSAEKALAVYTLLLLNTNEFVYVD